MCLLLHVNGLCSDTLSITIRHATKLALNLLTVAETHKYEDFVAVAAGGSNRGRVKEAAKSKESPPAKEPRQTTVVLRLPSQTSTRKKQRSFFKSKSF